jgi:hypothetical protein
LTTIDALKVLTMTNTDTPDDSEIDLQIEARLNAVLGDSYFAKPKQAGSLLHVSLSTLWRGIGAGVIEAVPHSDGHALTRHVLRPLMKYGIPRIPSVVGRKRA